MLLEEIRCDTGYHGPQGTTALHAHDRDCDTAAPSAYHGLGVEQKDRVLEGRLLCPGSPQLISVPSFLTRLPALGIEWDPSVTHHLSW